MNNTQRQLTVSQAARMLGWSPSTIRRLTDSGKMRSYRIPGSTHRRIPESEVVAMLEALPFSEPPATDNEA